MTGLDIDSGGVRISRWLLGILVTVLVTAWGGAATLIWQGASAMTRMDGAISQVTLSLQDLRTKDDLAQAAQGADIRQNASQIQHMQVSNASTVTTLAQVASDMHDVKSMMNQLLDRSLGGKP